MKKISFSILVLMLLVSSLSVVPSGLSAQTGTQTPPKLDYSGFVKCDGVLKPGEPDRQKECDFAALVDTINKLINWLFIISIPIATVLFAYAGLLYLTGSEKNIGKAKSIFTSVGIGFIIMIVAWLGVYTIVNWIISPQFEGATSLLKK